MINDLADLIIVVFLAGGAYICFVSGDTTLGMIVGLMAILYPLMRLDTKRRYRNNPQLLEDNRANKMKGDTLAGMLVIVTGVLIYLLVTR